MEDNNQYPPVKADAAQFGDDETQFHNKLITPESPDQYVQTQDGEVMRLPAYSHTMSIGNFDTRDLNVARLYFSIARIAENHGYYGVAIEWLTRVVDMSVTSLSHQGKLLTQLTTQHYGIYRKEEVSTDDDKKPGGDIMKKISELRAMDRKGGNSNAFTL